MFVTPTKHLLYSLKIARVILQLNTYKMLLGTVSNARICLFLCVRLEELEKKEEQQSDAEVGGDEVEGKEEEEEKEGEEEDGVMDEYEEDDPDEEMDEGTDYINSYFDNGESYLDEEDDNLDDGPIY